LSAERRVFEGVLHREDELTQGNLSLGDAYVVLSRDPPKIAWWQAWVTGLYGKRVRITVEVIEDAEPT